MPPAQIFIHVRSGYSFAIASDVTYAAHFPIASTSSSDPDGDTSWMMIGIAMAVIVGVLVAGIFFPQSEKEQRVNSFDERPLLIQGSVPIISEDGLTGLQMFPRVRRLVSGIMITYR